MITYHYPTGSRTTRTQSALVSLGPAVFNGGVTTFLAVIILPASKSHIFVTFFKVSASDQVFYLLSFIYLITFTIIALHPLGGLIKDKAWGQASFLT